MPYCIIIQAPDYSQLDEEGNAIMRLVELEPDKDFLQNKHIQHNQLTKHIIHNNTNKQPYNILLLLLLQLLLLLLLLLILRLNMITIILLLLIIIIMMII